VASWPPHGARSSTAKGEWIVDTFFHHRLGRDGLPVFAAALAAVLVACGGGGSIPRQATTAPSGGTTVEIPTPTAASAAAPQNETFESSDAAGDCFNGFGEPDNCAGLDLVGVKVGLPGLAPAVADDAAVQGRLVFVVTFADDVTAADEFGLYLYLDLDQDVATGLDMSSGSIALPGIDRLVGATLPQGDTWTQYVAEGGHDAEIVKDEGQVTTRVVGDEVVVAVQPSLLTDASGEAPDALTLYIGTARSIRALDYFNGDQPIEVPQALTVPEAVAAQAGESS
jgi:hypothetical protein